MCLKYQIFVKPYSGRVPLEVVQSFDVHFSDNYQHDRNLNVDILIGMDYYWEFVSPNNFIKKRGLLAMSTVLGWILSGSFSVNAINSPMTAQLLCIGANPPVCHPSLESSRACHNHWLALC